MALIKKCSLWNYRTDSAGQCGDFGMDLRRFSIFTNFLQSQTWEIL